MFNFKIKFDCGKTNCASRLHFIDYIVSSAQQNITSRSKIIKPSSFKTIFLVYSLCLYS